MFILAVPYPYPYPYPNPYAMPYPMPFPMPRAFPMPRPMPQPRPDGGKAQASPPAFQKDSKTPVVYAPYPGKSILLPFLSVNNVHVIISFTVLELIPPHIIPS